MCLARKSLTLGCFLFYMSGVFFYPTTYTVMLTIVIHWQFSKPSAQVSQQSKPIKYWDVTSWATCSSKIVTRKHPNFLLRILTSQRVNVPNWTIIGPKLRWFVQTLHWGSNSMGLYHPEDQWCLKEWWIVRLYNRAPLYVIAGHHKKGAVCWWPQLRFLR